MTEERLKQINVYSETGREVERASFDFLCSGQDRLETECNLHCCPDADEAFGKPR